MQKGARLLSAAAHSLHAHNTDAAVHALSQETRIKRCCLWVQRWMPKLHYATHTTLTVVSCTLPNWTAAQKSPGSVNDTAAPLRPVLGDCCMKCGKLHLLRLNSHLVLMPQVRICRVVPPVDVHRLILILCKQSMQLIDAIHRPSTCTYRAKASGGAHLHPPCHASAERQKPAGAA